MKHLLFVIALATPACKKSSGETTKPVEPAVTNPTPVSPDVTPPGPGPEAKTEPAAPAPPPPPEPRKATATLKPTAKSKVTGTITFKEVESGIEVTAVVEGLKAGNHAYHVHEKGDCSAPDGASAGGHFNPSKHKHGAPEADEHHEGDFGNLTADKTGKASKIFVMKGITLGADDNSIIGKGFIVHEKADDFKTQPTGNAGGRLACGVIELTP
ncbi:MAG: superoxide dismutase family protein [Kofleriaceae bacterium]